MPSPLPHSSLRAFHRFALSLLAALAILAILTLVPSTVTRAQSLVASTSPLPPAGGSSCQGWSVISTPDINYPHFYGIDALTSNDVWAVGWWEDGVYPTAVSRTLTEHWNGSQWSIIPSPSGSSDPSVGSSLVDVAAIASNDVWALGTTNGRPLALHWDGTAWTAVDTPYDPGGGGFGTDPQSIFAVSTDDVWAVGQYLVGSGHPSNLAIHWDGQEWSTVDIPQPGATENRLTDISGTGPDDIWAVGYNLTGGQGSATLLHWDGTSWLNTSAPANIVGGAFAVKAFAPDDVWAVGTFHNSAQSYDSPVALHYNGTAWQAVSMPPVPGFDESLLHGLDGSSPSDLWAVGTKRGAFKLVWSYHWDGTSWTQLYNPTPGGDDDNGVNIFGVTSVGPQDAWLSGYQTFYPIIERFGDPLTSCQLQFADVSPGSTFYQYVQCLACRTIVGGYPCGSLGEPCNGSNDPYFRPGNSITRGQLAKIISTASQYTPPYMSRRFQDVPLDSTFAEPINNLSIRSIIDGYPCGGPNEPCVAPDNLPYFRPGATATRGQIAKIISEAQRLRDDPGSQRFEDIPQGSTFYYYIQHLAARGAIGGYPCGGPGEPCIPPANRPYFRPTNNASRGQLTKIVNLLYYSDLTP